MPFSRNVTVVILGVLIGVGAGYYTAHYRASNNVQPAAPASPEGPPSAESEPLDLPRNHPEIADAGALAALKAAVDASPKNSDVQARYGKALLESGNLDEGVSVYRKAVALAPDNLEMRSMLGSVLYGMGKVEEARTELQTALAKNPNHLSSLHGMFVVVLSADHDIQKAAQILQTIEKLSPGYPGLAAMKESLESERKAAPGSH